MSPTVLYCTKLDFKFHFESTFLSVVSLLFVSISIIFMINHLLLLSFFKNCLKINFILNKRSLNSILALYNTSRIKIYFVMNFFKVLVDFL